MERIEKILENVMWYGGVVVAVLSSILLGMFIWGVIIPFFM